MSSVLDPITFPLHGTRLIEASAGTGKTYTVASLYLRLVLGGGVHDFSRPLMPPEILVVTFTNAATEELRSRIRDRLAAAASFFRSAADGDDFLQQLAGSYAKERFPALALRLEQAAQWMDEAAIHTIHGWCQRMLGQHAFDSGSLFDLELDPAEEELAEEAAADYWRCWLYPLDLGRLSLLRQFVPLSSPRALLPGLRELLEEETLAEADFLAVLETLWAEVETARQAWSDDLDEATATIHRAWQQGRLSKTSYNGQKYPAELQEIETWARGGPLPEARVLAKFGAMALEKGTRKGLEPPAHPAFAASDRLLAALEREREEKVLQRAFLVHAGRDIGLRLAAAKERLGRMGFDDLLRRFDAALAGPRGERLAATVRGQFPMALIDEFQDTDPLQYEIFRKLYQGRPECGLLLVGDPKQAIYSFRGADIHTYLRARADGGDFVFTLGRNYRSSTVLVKAVNHLFEAAGRHPEGAFLFGDRIPFLPVEAKGRDDIFVVEGLPAEHLTFWTMNQTAPVAREGAGGYLKTMAGAAASEIARLLNLGAAATPRAGFRGPAGFTPLRPSDIAVLVRDRFEAEAVRDQLRRRGLRSVYLSDKDSVFDSPQAEEVAAILHACAEPGSDRLLRRALACRSIALPLAELDRINREPGAWEREAERFRRYHLLWQERGVLPMLRALFFDYQVPARLLGAEGGERALTNLLHLAELLQEASGRLDGQQGLLRWLAEQRAGGLTAADEGLLRLESDEGLIRVVTVHKAKGLEYPLVFLPFVCGFREAAKSAMVLRFHDQEGRRRLVLLPGEEERERAERERLQEDLRLLYVAVTRARSACWLGMGVLGGQGDGNLLHRSAIGCALNQGRETALTELLPLLYELAAGCEGIAVRSLPAVAADRYRPPVVSGELGAARTFGGVVPWNWRITSYSGLLAGAGLEHGEVAGKSPATPEIPHSALEDQLHEAVAEGGVGHATHAAGVPGTVGEPLPGSIHAFPRGPDQGTFLHDQLEWAAGKGFSRLAAEPERLAERLELFCRRRDWGGWSGLLADWLGKVLAARLPLPTGGFVALAELGLHDCRAELEFLFSAAGVDSSALDRLIRSSVLAGRPRPLLRTSTVNGMLKGFVDLVFQHRGRFYLLDYKSNFLGADESCYRPEQLAAAMLGHRYDLQYVLYTLALHRLLRSRLPGYDYDRHMGGAVYLFLRGIEAPGCGVYADLPARRLVEELDTFFAGKGVENGD